MEAKCVREGCEGKKKRRYEFLKLINKISILPFTLFKKSMSFVSTNKSNSKKLYKTNK